MSRKPRLIRPTRWLRLLIMTVALLLVPAASAAAQSVQGTSTPEEAVLILVKPLYDPAAGNQACNALTGKVADCPVTDQLRTRLQNPVVNVETGNLVSRSQNPPRGVTLSLVDIVGDTARVNTVWDYPVNPYTLQFVVKNIGGKWLVADSFCADNPNSSIFNAPVGPCSASSGPGVVPGMPSTGSSTIADFALAVVIAAITMLIAGGAIRALRGKRAMK